MDRRQRFWELIRPYGRYIYYTLWPERRPSYFHNAWKIPSRELVRSSQPLPVAGSAGKPAIFFFPMTDWHVRVQRSQQLARTLASMGYKCIYVNPHLGLEYHKPYLFDSQPRASIHRSGVIELHVHLPREHDFTRRLLISSEVERVVSAVEDLIRAERISTGIVISSFPVWRPVAAKLRSSHAFPVIYDCHDLLEGFDRLPQTVISAERDAMNESDAVSFSAQFLMDQMLARLPSLRNKSSLIRNASDIEDFEIFAMARKSQEPPVIGYVGALDHWFDTAAVAMAAREHPDWTFELLGRIEDRRIQSLANIPNIRLMDEVSRSEVPKYLERWSAAMIPFLRNPLTLATNPIKLYEYLGAGLPVVSTRLPEVELFGDLVYLADNPAQFSASLTRALDEDSTSLAIRRQEATRGETWQARAKAMLALAGIGCISEVTAGML